MTEEQIRQNAEAYARQRSRELGENYGMCWNAYYFGAHSCDEEIQKLKESSVNCATISPSSVDPFNQLTFDVNFPGFVKEACENCNGGIYGIAWNMLNNLIGQVAQRATELHDPVLDALMIKLNLYELPNEERRKMISKLQQIYEEQVSK